MSCSSCYQITCLKPANRKLHTGNSSNQWEPIKYSQYIPSIFPVYSQYIPSIFPVYSQYIPSIFPVYSQYIPIFQAIPSHSKPQGPQDIQPTAPGSAGPRDWARRLWHGPCVPPRNWATSPAPAPATPETLSDKRWRSKQDMAWLWRLRVFVYKLIYIYIYMYYISYSNKKNENIYMAYIYIYIHGKSWVFASVPQQRLCPIW